MTEITKEQFEAYVDVQESGVTNMFDVKTVGQLSGLEKEQIMKIMTDYGTLKENGLKNPNMEDLKRYFYCDILLRKQGLLYFCRLIKEIEYDEIEIS